ncbi:hypothetical protein [Grimontia hollisae]|uniref:Uncharacterized protein n=1 Tax=Grimontia hollisae TaxID=673 RepID=A0A377HP14_GRIHO|nr:hypothetical protein [Grimontia hollisae]STO57455.1 Uncharacterised protein [Grimontia hollisae]
MPVFFWPLLAGGVGYVGGLFTQQTLSRALKVLVWGWVALFLIKQSGVLK